MHRLFGRAGTRTAAIVLLLALLLVPLLLHGHHADHASSGRPCVVCVVAKHSPVLQALAPAIVGPVLGDVAALPTTVVRLAHRVRPVQTGRGPPPSLPASFA